MEAAGFSCCVTIHFESLNSLPLVKAAINSMQVQNRAFSYGGFLCAAVVCLVAFQCTTSISVAVAW